MLYIFVASSLTPWEIVDDISMHAPNCTWYTHMQIQFQPLLHNISVDFKDLLLPFAASFLLQR